MEDVVVRTESVKSVSDTPFHSGVETCGQVGSSGPYEAPLRSNSISFFDLVEDLNKDICSLSPVGGNASNSIFQSSSPGTQDSGSALSTNMDFETLTGTAESAMQVAGATPPLSWTSEHSTVGTLPGCNPTAAAAPFGTAASSGAPFDSLLASAMPEDEVMSMTFAPAVKPKLEQVQALEDFFRRDTLDESPSLSGFDSRDSVYSAPGLEARRSYGDIEARPKAVSPAAANLNRSMSAAARMPVSMALLSRSLSVAAPPAIQRSYSTAGPGTNRPPKDGSLSALLPKDKLNRKRAAARRYYHNQKNKAVDYEVTIARLETENTALGKELMNALKKLELLKKSRSSPMSVC